MRSVLLVESAERPHDAEVGPAMAFGVFSLLALLAIPLFIFHIWALIDVLRTPASVWEQVGENQILWGVVVLFLSVLGPILYVMIARPKLVAAQTIA